MATVIGDRDVLLLGSSQRALNPLDSKIILGTSAPAFKVDSNGNALPSSITITAALIGIAGTVSFTATGATVTDNHDNTATLAYSSLTGTSCTVNASITVNGQAFNASVTLSKVTDGAKGDNGSTGNQYATVYMYQWAPSAPANPNGTTGYTWATGINSTYTGSDNWSVTVPSNPGTPSLKLYVAAVAITAPGGTVSTIVSYTTASVQAWAQNGSAGVSGIQSATLMVYQWAASIPAAPAGTTTYTWNGGALGSIPSGWTATPGIAPSQGITLWAAKVYVTDSATVTQTTINWTTSAIIAVGFSGSNGDAGPSGASYVTAYCASSTGTATSAPAQTTGRTSLPATNSAGLTGSWSTTVPALSVGQYLYQTDGIYDPSTDKVTWSIPYWSSLKVGNLSAITVNTGNLTVSGTISDASSNWSVDSNGHMIAESFELKDVAGNTFLSAGQPLPASHFGGTVGGDNLCPNSSFEVVSDGVLAEGWGIYNTNSAGEPATASTTTGRTGGNAQVISWINGHTAKKGIYRFGAARGGWIPGATYVVSFYAKTTNLSSASAMELDWNIAPSVTTTLSNPNLSTAWQRYAFRITWGGSAEVNGYVYISVAPGSGAGNVIFDDVLVVEGDVLPAYYPSALEADWSSVYGVNRPADNATVGAPSGTLVGSTLAQTVESNAANGNSAYSAVNDATNGLAQKLKSNAQNILSGGAGLSAGTLAWDGSGNRTSGYGVGINRNGIVAYNSSGVATFTLDGATGNATFAGTLAAPSGTFGAVTVASGGYVASGQTAYNTGTGFFLGYSGSTAVFSLGVANGTGIRWDGTSLTIQNPVIATPFSATITSSSSSYTISHTATNGFGGTYTANPSNGTGPYTYSWSVSTSGISRGWVGGSSTSYQAQLSVESNGRLNGDQQDFYMTCVVTDTSSNVSKTVTYLTTIYFS